MHPICNRGTDSSVDERFYQPLIIPFFSHVPLRQLTEEVIWNKYDANKVETLKYLDLSKSKWRSVEVRPTYRVHEART